ncbi:hypothetical protein [Paraburkholderia tropica]|uniref:hypothetical protein n=1 Tax=Paraburkholderia tropica TaxID=92647 RepID=UPI002AB671F5|nr:hypothetical protein [Paraburkholderia tropica]
MRERPILFSAPMVRAILDGSKTQTRRIVKPQPHIDALNNFIWNGWNFGQSAAGVPHVQSLASPVPWSKTKRVLCPFGAPGDRLWVRETWMDLSGTGIEPVTGSSSPYAYGADTLPGSFGDECRKEYGLKWRPSIHMPRAVSRITLEVTGVRVERLQSISDADAESEGIDFLRHVPDADETLTASQLFLCLWDSIATPGVDWAANPWVWVVDFNRVSEAA